MNIFQTPIPLIIVAAVVLIAVTIFRRALPERRKWWQLLLPAIVLLAAFGADFFSQTDHEKIDLLIKTSQEAAVAGDSEQIAKMISPDYRDSSHHSKELIVGFCRGFLYGPRPASSPGIGPRKIPNLEPICAHSAGVTLPSASAS